jgi:hypothetical protein
MERTCSFASGADLAQSRLVAADEAAKAATASTASPEEKKAARRRLSTLSPPASKCGDRLIRLHPSTLEDVAEPGQLETPH